MLPGTLVQVSAVLEWLVDFLGLQIFRLLCTAKACRPLLDRSQQNLWMRLLQHEIGLHQTSAPDGMCKSLSSRIPPDLRSLSISTCGIQKASNASLAESWRLMSSWFRPSLKKVELTFGAGITKQILKGFFKNLPKGLEKLCLNFEEVRPLERTLHLLSPKIAAMQCLKQLSLTFHEAEDASTLRLLLGSFPSEVSDLEIAFGAHNLDDLALRHTLVQALSQLSQLRCYSLTLIGCPDILTTDPVVQGELLGEMLGGIKCLKSLSLDILCCSIVPGSLEVLFRILAQATLERLAFSLSAFCIYDATAHLLLPPELQTFELHITNANEFDFIKLSFPASLRSLQLFVFDSLWSTFSFQSFLDELPTSLETLYVQIEWTALCDLKTLSHQILPSGLKELHFYALDPPLHGHASDSLKQMVIKTLATWVRELLYLHDITVRFTDEMIIRSSLEDVRLHGKEKIQSWAASKCEDGNF